MHLIKFKVAIRTENFQPSSLLDLVEYRKKIVRISKFGYTEPVKFSLDNQSKDKIVELYNKYLSIIFKGKNKLSISISVSPTGLSFFGGSINLNKNALLEIKELIEFISVLNQNDQVLYAYMCEEEEFNLKHRIQGDFSVSWKGLSFQDFQNFLPGVHWFTLFGSDLVKFIGRKKFDNLKNVIILENVGDDAIAFHLDTPITFDEERLNTLKKIEKLLGENMFFDKNKSEGSYQHHPNYKAFLSTFSRGY